MRVLILLLTFMSFWGGGLETLEARDRIRASLVAATQRNVGEPPESINHAAPAIRSTFGYPYVEVLGQSTRSISQGHSEWLVPSKEFFFQVTCLKQEEAGYRVTLELYQQKQLLLRADAFLARNKPLLVRGPQWGKDQLVMVLEIL
jgi:hypothetical protein